MLFICAEVLAVALALQQFMMGVHTDEAKYLLNIPYPHPPLARWILGLTDGWIHQELFWRIVFATLMVQAVWLVWGLGHALSKKARIALCIAWLCSVPMWVQAGTVMMAPLTALQALLFLWLLDRNHRRPVAPLIIGLLWLASLFTAYQAVLFAPIVLVIVWKLPLRRHEKLFYWIVPLALLTLYTFSNPLALASMMIHAGKDASDTLDVRLLAAARVWLIGGSGLIAVLGTIGIIKSRSFALIGSFLLVLAFVFLARFDYYAVLFLPLFVAGLVPLLRSMKRLHLLVSLGSIACVAAFALPTYHAPQPSIARTVCASLTEREVDVSVISIEGAFGHEWQYECGTPSRNAPVRICTQECAKPKTPGWKLIQIPGVYGVWIRS